MRNYDQIKKWQTRIFIACFIAYTAAYICRVNLSIAIPGIQSEFGFSNASIGLISTSFFWVYALGQLINGFVGDMVSSRTFIFVGLTASALINIAFGLSSVLWMMVLLWSVNGIFQSMLWAPMIKTLSNWFPSKLHNKIVFGMSITTIAGYIIAWGISGLIMNTLGWRWVFWLAALIVISFAFVWYTLVRNKPVEVGLTGITELEEQLNNGEITERQSSKKESLIKTIFDKNIFLIVLTGAAQGVIKESISLWSPKILMDTFNLSLKSTVAIVLIIPAMNLIGITLAGWLNRTLRSSEQTTIMILMIGSAVASLGMVCFMQKSPALTILMLACNSAFIYGANPLMTTAIPLKYSASNKVATIAGIVDSSIYLGAGLAGVLTGLTVDMFGWSMVFVMWCIVSLLGSLTIRTTILPDKKIDSSC